MCDKTRSEIIMHIGAHKTATSFIQESILENLAEIDRRGAHYLSESRKDIRFFLSGSHPFEPNRIANILNSDLQCGRINIFSDEDSLGRASLRRGSSVYPNISDVISRIKSIQDYIGLNFRILFSIRSYVDFIPSVYQQEIKRGCCGYSFSEYIEKRVSIDNISWVPVVSELSNNFKGDLTVWDYEKFRTDPCSIWSQFGLGDSFCNFISNNKSKNKISNKSLSKDGIDILTLLYGKLDKDTHRKLERLISRALSKSPGHPGFYTWSESQKYNLISRYSNELDLIKVILKKNNSKFLCVTRD